MLPPLVRSRALGGALCVVLLSAVLATWAPVATASPVPSASPVAASEPAAVSSPTSAGRAVVRAPAEPVARTGPKRVRLVSAERRGNDKIVLTFSGRVGRSAGRATSYATRPNLFVRKASILSDRRSVVLGTGVQYAVGYRIQAKAVRTARGAKLATGHRAVTFRGTVPVDRSRPRVVSAGSVGNRGVVVQFSKPMDDATLRPRRFEIVRESTATEVGGVEVAEVRFADRTRTRLRLLTGSQSQVSYRVRVSNVRDLRGLPLADRTGGRSGVDPTTAVFGGSPAGVTRRDSDCDGLYDDEEALGYRVRVVNADGEAVFREVTSDPGRRGASCTSPSARDDRDRDGVLDSADTDRDGLNDKVERELVTDPRDDDTDEDALTDYVEYNEIYSDPLSQDTDGDSLTDGLETSFFFTSAILADTDGDQLSDDEEVVLGTRNPRLADLPRPALEIGELDLGLDVRFTDTTGTRSTVVDSETVESTLTQTESQLFSSTDTRTLEAGSRLTTTAGFTIGVQAGADRLGARVSQEYSFETSTEQSFNSTFTSSFTDESTRETQRAFEDSQTSSVEQGESADRQREVQGGRMQVAVDLKADGDIAFNLSNLQITALIQDPQVPTRLTPVATLVPSSEPDSGFNLGPLVPVRGPIIFENTTVFPSLVEDLMRNPRGLVFRFSNYDITDELGRNFAFTSQAINDRTAGLSIDYGGYDSDNDGVGDETEMIRIATGTGRRIDTDFDGDVDERDRRAAFGPDGETVGITLRDAMAAAGLTHYDELETPTSTLTQRQVDTSYSTVVADDGGLRVWRVRDTATRPDIANTWQILTPTGIDEKLTLDTMILDAGQSFTIAYLADTDQDRVPAIIESLNGCVDSPLDADGDGLAESLDTDGDGLDDRFEIYVGWDFVTERGTKAVRSRCASPDTDNDGVPDDVEAPSVITRDEDGLIVFTPGNEPARDITGPRDPLVDWALTDPITDPTSADSDQDGLTDDYELTPNRVRLIEGPNPPDTFTAEQLTSPEHFDSDRDSASDGVETAVGGDPRTPDSENFGDSDGDGVVNILEEQPLTVRWRSVSAGTGTCDSVCAPGMLRSVDVPDTDKLDADSDDDGLGDGEERLLGTNPRLPDTDGDSLSDFEEVRGLTVRDLGIITTDPLRADSDSDRRSDGAEAGRISSERIIVRVPGEAPYIGVSDPNEADTDLDRLVDGDEAREGTDPGHHNTDRDNRSDYNEVTLPGGGRRPLVPDLRVRVTFTGIYVDADGDSGESAGDFQFAITTRDATGRLNCLADCSPSDRLSNFQVNSWADGPFGIDVVGCGNNQERNGICRWDDTSIQADSPHTIMFPPRESYVGSVSTTDALPETFQVEGFIHEFEQDYSVVDCRAIFPDPQEEEEEPAGNNSGIFSGGDLEVGVQLMNLRREDNCDTGGDNRIEMILRAFYTAD